MDIWFVLRRPALLPDEPRQLHLLCPGVSADPRASAGSSVRADGRIPSSGYLYAFFCVLIAYYFVFDELRLKKFGAIFLILISSLVFLKNFQRVKNQYKKNYIEYPWLKIYSEKDNKKNNFTKIYFKNNSKFFYFYPNGKLCFYSPGICSYKNKNGLQIIVERNYKIIKIK